MAVGFQSADGIVHIGGDPRIDLLSDLVGGVFLALLFCSDSVWTRRFGVLMIVLSGADGVMKLWNAVFYPHEFRGVPMYEPMYQLPWIAAGLIALRWFRNPPSLLPWLERKAAQSRAR